MASYSLRQVQNQIPVVEGMIVEAKKAGNQAKVKQLEQALAYWQRVLAKKTGGAPPKTGGGKASTSVGRPATGGGKSVAGGSREAAPEPKAGATWKIVKKGFPALYAEAGRIHKQLIREGRLKIGTTVPFTLQGRQFMGRVEHHGWTTDKKTGKKIYGNYTGFTVYELR